MGNEEPAAGMSRAPGLGEVFGAAMGILIRPGLWTARDSAPRKAECRRHGSALVVFPGATAEHLRQLFGGLHALDGKAAGCLLRPAHLMAGPNGAPRAN